MRRAHPHQISLLARFSVPAVCCSVAQLLQRQFTSACDHQSDRGVPAARLLPSFLAQFRQLRLSVQGGANGAAAAHSLAEPDATTPAAEAAEAAEAADGVAAHSDDHVHPTQSAANSARGSADDGDDDGDGGAQRMSISPL